VRPKYSSAMCVFAQGGHKLVIFGNNINYIINGNIVIQGYVANPTSDYIWIVIQRSAGAIYMYVNGDRCPAGFTQNPGVSGTPFYLFADSNSTSPFLGDVRYFRHTAAARFPTNAASLSPPSIMAYAPSGTQLDTRIYTKLKDVITSPALLLPSDSNFVVVPIMTGKVLRCADGGSGIISNLSGRSHAGNIGSTFSGACQGHAHSWYIDANQPFYRPTASPSTLLNYTAGGSGNTYISGYNTTDLVPVATDTPLSTITTTPGYQAFKTVDVIYYMVTGEKGDG